MRLSDSDMSKVARMAGIAEGRSKQRAYSAAKLVDKCSKSETAVFLSKRKANDKAFHRNMKRVEAPSDKIWIMPDGRLLVGEAGSDRMV